MKKKYISPTAKLIMVHTENMLASLSDTNVSNYKGETGNQGIGSDIGTWDGNSQPESAKKYNGFDFWDDGE